MRISVIITVMLIALLAGLSYFLYFAISNFVAEPIPFIQNFSPELQVKNQTSYKGELQFYPNMRFAKKTLIYNIEPSCNEKKQTRMRRAFLKLENETGLLKFYRNIYKEKADILVSCQESELAEKIPGEYYIAGEGGPTAIINTSLFYVIEKGKVLLLYKESACNNYNVELHELLHVFGFKHSENKKSVMYNTTFCNQVLTQDIIEELKRLYSIEELPDLYIENVSAIKEGIYLSFDVQVRNQGLSDAENVTLELYSNGKKIDEFDLGKINYGEGKILEVKDKRLHSRKDDSIKFVLVSGKELDKENNIIELFLASS